MPDIDVEEVDYNLVQNNGIGAAQVVGHVHWHLVPRYPFDYAPPPLPLPSREDQQGDVGQQTQTPPGDPRRKYTPIPAPEGFEATRVMFGRGQRHYRDDEDAEALVAVMRERVREEWERSFPEHRLEVTAKQGRGEGEAKAKEREVVQRDRERGGKL